MGVATLSQRRIHNRVENSRLTLRHTLTDRERERERERKATTKLFLRPLRSLVFRRLLVVGVVVVVVLQTGWITHVIVCANGFTTGQFPFGF